METENLIKDSTSDHFTALWNLTLYYIFIIYFVFLYCCIQWLCSNFTLDYHPALFLLFINQSKDVCCKVVEKECREDWEETSRRAYLNYYFVYIVKLMMVSPRLPLVMTNARFATSSIWFILSFCPLLHSFFTITLLIYSSL